MSYPNPSYLPENALKHGGWIFLLLLLGIFGDVLNPYLQYSRESISSGQVWRLLSGHIVHLGWFHSVINMLGWLGVVWVFRGLYVLKIVEVVKDTNFIYMDIIFQKGVITHRALGPTKKCIAHLIGIICYIYMT